MNLWEHGLLKNLIDNWWNFEKHESAPCCEIWRTCAEICKWQCTRRGNSQQSGNIYRFSYYFELETCCKMSLWLRKSASFQEWASERSKKPHHVKGPENDNKWLTKVRRRPRIRSARVLRNRYILVCLLRICSGSVFSPLYSTTSFLHPFSVY